MVNLAETVIAPWRKAVEQRDRIIETVKGQRERLGERLGEYVEALKQRDNIIEELTQERNDLRAELEAIKNGEKPATATEAGDIEMPPVPGDVPGDGAPGATP